MHANDGNKNKFYDEFYFVPAWQKINYHPNGTNFFESQNVNFNIFWRLL
jgi:hypothetical protein